MASAAVAQMMNARGSRATATTNSLSGSRFHATPAVAAARTIIQLSQAA